MREGVYIADAMRGQCERVSAVAVGDDNDARSSLNWFPKKRGRRRDFYPVLLVYARIE